MSIQKYVETYYTNFVMKNFHINTGDEPIHDTEGHLFEVGTSITFELVAGHIRSAIRIPVIFA